MPQSWSGIRKRLEQDLLCQSLRGRVQYFRTIYNRAPDQYGRFAVRVDGAEWFRANPWNENRYYEIEDMLREERNIPLRKWTGNRCLYDEENTQVEEEARLASANEGIVDSYDVPRAIQKYLNQGIEESLADQDPVVRMFAILDRRVGKRRLREMEEGDHAEGNCAEKQPEWLRKFYKLRLEAEGQKDYCWDNT